ncbi:hypothetical protein ACOI22_09310 [Glaciecola sp. 2405UD65-10]|uniref:hypothetical protein n=1 Tax=Glaciecola sp. 2405UD65-10 TaxID=3397244 RepID=UPI003B5B100A
MKNLLLLSLFAASGQTIAMQASPSVNELLECKVISDNQKRLTCFDKLASQIVLKSDAKPKLTVAPPTNTPSIVSLPPAPVAASKPLVTVPQTNEDQNKVKVDVFGLEHKQVIISDSDSITALVANVKKAPHGELVITLDNEQVWRQTSSERLRIKSDDTVVVTRGALNSFLLKKEGSSRAIRVKRVK